MGIQVGGKVLGGNQAFGEILDPPDYRGGDALIAVDDDPGQGTQAFARLTVIDEVLHLIPLAFAQGVRDRPNENVHAAEVVLGCAQGFLATLVG